MSNEERYIITCRFPSWRLGEKEYSPFGVKYLIRTGVMGFPEWADDDERWLTYDPDTPILEEFKKQYFASMGRVFKGEVLFIEQTDVVVLGDK